MKLFILAAALAVSSFALAQHSHVPHPHHHAEQTAVSGSSSKVSPYSGMQSRAIKALSPQQVEDLQAGKGMSLALPAELNGYPGPLHVLEMAEKLHLTNTQRTRTERLLAEMKHETTALGEKLIAAETILDRLFRERRATTKLVEDATADAAQVQGALRAAHLRYHLLMVEVLEPEQMTQYDKLREYR